ncbi:hypothetical protein [uncultured Flavobacterium sp.]|uniref:hypothetical protein n=1 Tax=uncultured Flavobacterium sp. TaxID=165435 RepID=UPI0030CA1421
MKKLVVIALLVAGFTTFAQENGRKQNNKNFKPEQRVEMQVKKMTENLNLDEKQQKEITAFLNVQKEERAAFADKRKALKEGAEKPSKEQREAMKKTIEKKKIMTKEKMKSILNENQYKKWESLMEENQNNRKEKMQQRNNKNNQK